MKSIRNLGFSAFLAATVAWATPVVAANPVIVVTSNKDDPGGDGNKRTLREALALAASRPGEDRIIFSSIAYFTWLERTLTVNDPDGVTIDGDSDDDGIGTFYLAHGKEMVALENAKGSKLKLSGVLIYLGGAIGKSGETGLAGLPGTAGANGVSYNQNTDPVYNPGNDIGKPGGHGKPGNDGQDGSKGSDASPIAVVVNRGSLTIVRSGFAGLYAVGYNGGNGGAGGRGGNGGTGGNGGPSKYRLSLDSIDALIPPGGPGGNGARGGNGGAGGNAGTGGDAAGAIFNDRGGSINLVDVNFGGRSIYGIIGAGNRATAGGGGWGGGGGLGGAGGNGGIGGPGGVRGLRGSNNEWKLVPKGLFMDDMQNGTFLDHCHDEALHHACGLVDYTLPGAAGNGNDGGNAGRRGLPGKGGDAAGAILNYGKVTGEIAVTDSNKATAGKGGDSGAVFSSGGIAGPKGLGGLHKAGKFYALYTGVVFGVDIANRPDGVAGRPGLNSARSLPGPDGVADKEILSKNGGTSSVKIGEGLVFVHDLGLGQDALKRPVLSFNIIRFGAVDSNVTVRWRVVPGKNGKPVSAGDFIGGAMPSGSVVLERLAPSVGFDADKNARNVSVRLTSKALLPAGKTYVVELLPILGSGAKPILGTSLVAGKLAAD